MSQRVKKLPCKGKGEDGTQAMSKSYPTPSVEYFLTISNQAGSKGKRKRPRTAGGGTKGSGGGGNGGSGLQAQSGDDGSSVQSSSQPDSTSKTPWTPRYLLSDLKSSNIYNRSATEAPAEVCFSLLS
jgi:hypothetical protein